MARDGSRSALFDGVPWTKHTEHTIDGFDAFREELGVVCARGYALESEEYEGACSVPPFRSAIAGAIAALATATVVIGLRLGWNP